MNFLTVLMTIGSVITDSSDTRVMLIVCQVDGEIGFDNWIGSSLSENVYVIVSSWAYTKWKFDQEPSPPRCSWAARTDNLYFSCSATRQLSPACPTPHRAR